MTIERRAADLVLTGATVRTMDGRETVASAVAIRGGRIAGIGTDADLEPLVDSETRVVRVRGAILPAFGDGHTHLHTAAISSHYCLDLMADRRDTISEVLEAVRGRASATPKGTWIQADGFSDHDVAEGRFPTRRELDAAAPDHPVVIRAVGFHMFTANSAALSAAGITRDSADPPGGRIERDAHGELTGVLRERARYPLEPRRKGTVIPQFTPEQRLAALRAAVQRMHAQGVVSVHEMIHQPMELADWQLLEPDEPRLRIQFLIRGVEAQTSLEQVLGLGLATGLGDDWLRFGGIKLSVDGACVFRNAAVYEGYPGEPENRGIVRIEQDQLDEIVFTCHARRLRVAIHAIGQRAVDMALDSIEHAIASGPVWDHRHRIEHGYLPPRSGQLQRMSRLGVILSTQPSFMESFSRGWRRTFGEDLTGFVPLRTALAIGVRLQGGSDQPCSPSNPLAGIACAVTRRSAEGIVVDPGQAISVGDAVRMITSGTAYGGFDEGSRGTIELGKLADLVVLDEDPFSPDLEDPRNIAVAMTLVGGQIVHQA